MSILQWPDPRVTTPCEQVEPEEMEAARKLAVVLIEALRASRYRPGIGLSANQIGGTMRVFVVDTNMVRGLDAVYINPVFEPVGEEKYDDTEACLSLPSRCLPTVPRWKTIRVQWTRPDGERCESIVDNLRARVVQHEVDHLDGLLISRFLSRQARRQLEREVSKGR